jgi:hypothetical protein
MQVTEIRVEASVTVASANRAYSNVKPSVVMVATLAADDDPELCARQLQQRANSICIEHASHLLGLLNTL